MQVTWSSLTLAHRPHPYNQNCQFLASSGNTPSTHVHIQQCTDISLPLQETRTAAELALQLRAFDTYIDWDALQRPAAAEVDILFGGAEILQRRQAGSAPPPTAVPTAESGVTCCAISSGQWSMLQLEAWPGLRQQQSWGKDP